MTKLCIHYRMSTERSKDREKTVDSCITLSMLDIMAVDIMSRQWCSPWVQQYTGTRNVYDVLRAAAALQGYESVEFLKAETAE